MGLQGSLGGKGKEMTVFELKLCYWLPHHTVFSFYSLYELQGCWGQILLKTLVRLKEKVDVCIQTLKKQQ